MHGISKHLVFFATVNNVSIDKQLAMENNTDQSAPARLNRHGRYVQICGPSGHSIFAYLLTFVTSSGLFGHLNLFVVSSRGPLGPIEVFMLSFLC